MKHLIEAVIMALGLALIGLWCITLGRREPGAE